MHYRVTEWDAIQRGHEANLSVVTLLGFMGRLLDISTKSVLANTRRTHYI